MSICCVPLLVHPGGRGGTVEPSVFTIIEKPHEKQLRIKTKSVLAGCEQTSCFASKQLSSPSQPRSQRNVTNPQVRCLKSSKMPNKNLRKLRENIQVPAEGCKLFRERRPKRSCNKSQKWLVKIGTPKNESNSSGSRVAAEKRKRHHGVSSRTALLSRRFAK